MALRWKTRALVLLATGLACLPMAAHAEMDASMRVERTSAFDVVLSIGPAQGMGEMSMQPPAMTDTGMAVNHWLDVHVSEAGSGAAVNDLMPIIRIVDKSTGEARDLPSVMAMAGGMNAADFHYGQNVFLPDGTYQISVLLGPADTAQFRDVVVMSSQMMSAPGMNGGHDMGTTEMPGMHP